MRGCESGAGESSGSAGVAGAAGGVLDHFQAEARHARDTLGSREHAHLSHAQVLQDLRADAVQSGVPLA